MVFPSVRGFGLCCIAAEMKDTKTVSVAQVFFARKMCARLQTHPRLIVGFAQSITWQRWLGIWLVRVAILAAFVLPMRLHARA
jgi:hypothetical protein